MRFLRNLLIFVAVVVGLLVVIGFVLPDTAHVERSVTVDRPPSQVFTVLNSFRRFNEWSPWFDLDRNAKYTYSGPAVGVGAKESWVGDKKNVGTGSQTIVESKPYESIRTALDFGDMGQAAATFTLTPAGQGTKVVWGLDINAGGKLIGRYFNLMMDSMVGKDYEKGLAKLKTFVEGMPAADVGGVNGNEVTVAARKIYFIPGTATSETAKTVLTDAYSRIGTFMAANKITMQGAPLTVTTGYDANRWAFNAGVPVDRNDVPPTGDIQSGNTYGGKAVQFMHVGPYEQLPATTTKAYAWLALMAYKPVGGAIEEYVNDPTTVPPEQIKTLLTIPVQ
jgi:effector-binding domain-containing protein/carbon monoxide dehydrogenase subunit G